MASMWRKAMLYLGLGPDEEYDDFDVAGEHAPAPAAAPPRPSSPRPGARAAAPPPGDVDAGGAVRTLSPSAAEDSTGNGNGHGRGPAVRARAGPEPGKARPAGDAERRGRGGVVRPLTGATAKPFVVGPKSFNDAQEVADKFKVGVPVIVNLQGVERDLSRRIIDFASGLCYGLGGQMERVANHVYLLTRSDVEVSLEERRRLRERGYES